MPYILLHNMAERIKIYVYIKLEEFFFLQIPPKIPGCRATTSAVTSSCFRPPAAVSLQVIRRDIARTYPEHALFKQKDGLGQESLFNVMKAYSVHDREVQASSKT